MIVMRLIIRGKVMTAESMWKLFMETGDIAFYLIYKALVAENKKEKPA